MFHQQRVRVVPASLKVRPIHRHLRTYDAKAAVQSAATAQRMGSRAQTDVRLTNIRLTKWDVTPVAFTDTTFFVIVRDEGTADQPVYQIQWWRVMVLHPVVDANSNKIPAKQT